MKLYKLINPSDCYTFYAPSIEVAGACTAFLSTNYGAKEVDGEESTPIMFGWGDWMADRGIDEAWIASHYAEMADCYESFLIGSPCHRKDIDDAAAAMTPEARKTYLANRHEKNRSSMNNVGKRALQIAEALRKKIDQ